MILLICFIILLFCLNGVSLDIKFLSTTIMIATLIFTATISNGGKGEQ